MDATRKQEIINKDSVVVLCFLCVIRLFSSLF